MPPIHSVEPAHACFAFSRLTGCQHRFPLLRKPWEILGMDYGLPVPTMHIGFRRYGHFHHVSTIQCSLQRKPEIIQPTFIYVIKIPVSTKSIYHRGSCIHHKPKTLLRESLASPEFLFRLLPPGDVHHRSDKLNFARFAPFSP